MLERFNSEKKLVTFTAAGFSGGFEIRHHRTSFFESMRPNKSLQPFAERDSHFDAAAR